MSEATVRGYLKDVLDGVADIGIVHDYERWANNQTAFLDLFKTIIGLNNVIRGWTISCAAASQEWLNEPEFDGQGQIIRTYRYVIRGFLGLDDAAESEKTAWALAETIMQTLDSDAVLHGESQVWTVTPPAQLTLFEPRLFGGVLCHYIEITQQVSEVISL